MSDFYEYPQPDDVARLPVGHVLTIGPGENGHVYKGRLTYKDGTTETFYADERPRLLAKVQKALEMRQQASVVQEETLIFDDYGGIVREPIAHSMKVRP